MICDDVQLLFPKCPYHHHLSPISYLVSPITRWPGSRGRARSTSPAVACRRHRCYRPRRPWVGSRPGAGVPLRVGTGRAGVSAMTRRANRGKRRGGMEREVRSGRVSWYLDGDSPSNGRVSARHSSSTMSRSCPATITVASEPLISPSRGCVVSLFQIFGFLSWQPQPPTRFPTNWDFRDLSPLSTSTRACSIAHEPHRSSPTDVPRAFNRVVTSIHASTSRTHRVPC